VAVVFFRPTFLLPMKSPGEPVGVLLNSTLWMKGDSYGLWKHQNPNLALQSRCMEAKPPLDGQQKSPA
jgi:hypothetical protein